MQKQHDTESHTSAALKKRKKKHSVVKESPINEVLKSIIAQEKAQELEGGGGKGVQNNDSMKLKMSKNRDLSYARLIKKIQ